MLQQASGQFATMIVVLVVAAFLFSQKNIALKMAGGVMVVVAVLVALTSPLIMTLLVITIGGYMAIFSLKKAKKRKEREANSAVHIHNHWPGPGR